MKHFTHSEPFQIGTKIYSGEYSFAIKDVIICRNNRGINMPDGICCNECRDNTAYLSNRSGKLYCSKYDWKVEE